MPHQPACATPARPILSGLLRQARALALVLAGAGVGACGGEPTPPPDNPVPDVSAVAPAFVERNAPETDITVAGSDFVSASVVRMNGSSRPTTYVSRTQLRATLPPGDFTAVGSLQLQVFNPAPGGGTSRMVVLEVVQPANPVPTVSAATPAVLTAGSSSGTVTITGTGFNPQTLVHIGTLPQATTLLSPTSLQVTLTTAHLATSGVLTLVVANPLPGGGTALATVEVQSPVPTLASLSTTTTEAGQAQLALHVTGTGFLSNSVVQVDGAPRPTTWVSGTTLDVVLPAGDLTSAGTLSITVVNPTPGGGTSGALSLQLLNGQPVITELPTRGASAGGGGFSLSVHGRAFVPASVVHWNGAARPTQYVSGTRIIAEIPASEVAAAGVAQVTVTTPAPGGGTSGAQAIDVRALGAATATSVRSLSFDAGDLVVDDARSLVYLSIRPTAPADANNVVAVDLATGAVTKRVFVGIGPGRLALSSDGQYLHVGLDGASAVRRVLLSNFTASLQWSLPSGQVAGDMVAVPGRAGSVVISRHQPGLSPSLQGVTVYDDGMPRSQSAPGHSGGSTLTTLSSPDTVYGFNNATTGYDFFTIVLDQGGARHALATKNLIAGYTRITGAAGRIYGSDGSVVDAARHVEVGAMPVPTFPVQGHAMGVDATLGRAFIPVEGGIAVFDVNTFQRIGTVGLQDVFLDHAGPKTRMLRWGADGIAFTDQGRLFLVRSPLFGP